MLELLKTALVEEASDKSFPRAMELKRELSQTRPDVATVFRKRHAILREIYKQSRSVNYALAPYVRDNPKIGRNDPCSCGSGKKYKKCCMGL